MKKLSDYQGEEAIELWADLLEPCMAIFTEPAVKEAYGKKPMLEVAKIILKTKAKEATEMLTRIDDTPLNGANAFLRLSTVLTDMMTDDSARSFFGFAAQETPEQEHSGSATENTKDN